MSRALLFTAIWLAACGVLTAQEGGTGPAIHESSLRALTSVEDPDWLIQNIFCSGNGEERLFQLRVLDYQGSYIFVFFGAVYKTGEVTLYVVDRNGSLIRRRSVPHVKGTSYYLDNDANFRLDGDLLLYFVDDSYAAHGLDIATGDYDPSIEYIFQPAKSYPRAFDSPSRNRTVEVGTVKLTVVDNATARRTLLFEQTYTGQWSLGRVSWADEDLFYFDNDGAVACIWQVDLQSMTLTKIVPEHAARFPVCLMRGDEILVAYFERDCLKTASKRTAAIKGRRGAVIAGLETSAYKPAAGGSMFTPHRAFDGDRRTAWALSGKDAIGAFFELELASPITVDMIAVIGCYFSARRFRQHNRIKQIELRTERSVMQLPFRDKMMRHRFGLSEEISFSRLRLTIEDTFAGSNKDVYLPEVTFYHQGQEIRLTLPESK